MSHTLILVSCNYAPLDFKYGPRGRGLGTRLFSFRWNKTTRSPQSVSQSVISRSRPALTPLPARSPAPPLPV